MESIYELVMWFCMAVSTIVGYFYFRDLGDVTQAMMTVKRKNMIFAIRHENSMIAVALIGTAISVGIHLWLGIGNSTIIKTVASVNVFFVAFPWIWLHLGLRNQQYSAKYYSIEHAKNWLRASESVIVIENNGEARAHSDYHIKRPHLAGSPEGLGGDNIILTYCCMTHLGHGFKPEIEGEKLDLEVLAQHGNNLIMKDMNTGEPIQQVYGTRECDGRYSDNKMQEWPTFRMSFKGFQKAYPDGKVFLNKIPKFTKNPLYYIIDQLVEAIFLWGTIGHDRQEALMFNTMDVEDNRLPKKEYVWGFNIGKDSVAFTQDFIEEHNNLINTKVGGKDIVVSYDRAYDSVGIYYNDSGEDISSIDFFGQSDKGLLPRVETVKAAIYWCVWVNFFPETDLNRTT